MRKTDFNEVKQLDIKALRVKIVELKNEIADLRLDKNMNKLKDLKTIWKKRKGLAQVSTVLRQKQLIEELESRTGSQEPGEKKSEEVKAKKENK